MADYRTCGEVGQEGKVFFFEKRTKKIMLSLAALKEGQQHWHPLPSA
jgi:hypothetical protein